MTEGYAVKYEGKIDVTTVGPHERAAMVNWLYRRGLLITSDWTDDIIEQVFDEMRLHRGKHELEVVRVNITETPDAQLGG